MSASSIDFLYSENSLYIAELYVRYCENPSSVDPSWIDFFKSLGDKEKLMLHEMTGASWGQPKNKKVIGSLPPSEPGGNKSAKPKADFSPLQIQKAMGIQKLCDAFRRYGHYNAHLDPLSLKENPFHPELDPVFHGLEEADLHQPMKNFGLKGDHTVRDEIIRLGKMYCGTTGYEVCHIPNQKERAWIHQQIETPFSFSNDDKKTILENLMKADLFESFLATKFVGAKRFGLEGGDSLISMLHYMTLKNAQRDMGGIVYGMAHRGRLNVMVNILDYPVISLLAKFKSMDPKDPIGAGDVKYHLGASCDKNVDGHSLHLSLCPNPSHLESVNAVVMGNTWAKQHDDKMNILPILIHGDAAAIGQGSVAEALQMANLPAYYVGGSLHIIINNQIGFTTNPTDSRSSYYCSDIAKTIDAPVFHVNGNDPEACVRAVLLALNYRQKFGKDAFVDLICYRKNGHNEGDEPIFTQPIMYRTIRQQEAVYISYADDLINDGIIDRNWVENIKNNYMAHLQSQLDQLSDYEPKSAEWLNGRWADIVPSDSKEAMITPYTGVEFHRLLEMGNILTTAPTGFNINSKIEKQFEARRETLKKQIDLDWSMGEGLAFATLLAEQIPIRLVGQDARRGTFSHRHGVLFDQTTAQEYSPYWNISSEQGAFDIWNSLLSEYAAMAFEYGVSWANPHRLVIWEAQFGDFANGAQVVIDQYISSAESKWHRMSGLVLLLPHCMDGQGPEHSSARLERYLQLCAEDNMQVVYPTTPANIFHALRRQVHRNIRKPLIVMSPKSLLRHKKAVSNLEDFGPLTKFKEVLVTRLGTKKVKKVILCSGKVYYDLLMDAEQRTTDNIALVRLEQLYPFPQKQLEDVFNEFSSADIVWCQEEPKNMGAWTFVSHKLLPLMGKRPLRYAGRPESASPAVGSAVLHAKEQQTVMNSAFL